MKKKYYLLLLSALTSLSQTQIGTNINGEAGGDKCGWGYSSVALSSNGNIVAIGSPDNDENGEISGHVRVYQTISGVWTQIGADINGEAANDQSGWSVALSSDGNIVAIGASGNDGNGIDSGHVRVYQNISGVWTQIGTDINGEAAYDSSGWSVALSSDGNILAIGAYGNVGNGIDSGHVRVYQNISGIWSQIGTDIDSEASGDQSGWKVALSSDGNIVAIGAPNNDGNGNNSGHVRVYQNVSGIWSQIGTDIDGEAIGNKSGFSIALSSDGNIVAIGAPLNGGNGNNSGHVRIFQNISGTWTQTGTDINGETANEQSGWNIALSSDSSKVAVAAPFNNSNGNYSGNLRVFELPSLSSDSFLKPNFSIYPNPSKGSINITLDNDLLLEEINIYNQLGQIVKTTSTNTISTVDLSKGIYNVEVLTSNGKVTKKMIVE